ncbi:MAG: N-6 DNA methylase [Anaerolinea sp.]|nr:N-6 DNA methylase [Anaerolinea sp.]
MQTVAQNNFITVKTEGGILPAELLQRIADGQTDGLNPTDYHLGSGERLNEAINRSWLHLMGRWQTFRQKMENMAPGETGTTLTRDWTLTVLQELGYGRLPFTGSISVRNPLSVNRHPTTAHGSWSTDDGSRATDHYPISHLYDHTPIHLVAFRQRLDSRDDSQASKRSPHSLAQECLNRSDNYLWAFVSNGLRFRILRDNVSLTRAAYVEFDLEAMFNGEVYSDFSLFWLLCHQSRVEIRDWRLETEEESSIVNPSAGSGQVRQSSIANCWLEKWSQQATEQGTRALDALRDGVQEAIVALGRGFLAQPGNRALQDDLKSGALTTQDYYRQLLRLVYRLLFLFVAEDRDLLLLPGTPTAVRQQVNSYYSVSRLRRLAETRRGGPHPDLYRTLAHLFASLRAGYAPLGLPGLGGFLFSPRATPDLDTADIANQDLLNAIRALAFTVEGRVRRPVDYKNMGSEELGSVYESLLELHPQLHVGAATFALDVAAGSERKTTGSYYTPASLIQSLLDTALEPVVADRLQQVRSHHFSGETAKAVTTSLSDAILDIKIVDPACGSGHFLIAAARRLARHLARVRTGDDEPGPEAARHALRDVVGRCIHGVDINEMAVELCKVALWMETLHPGRPLSFLDKNIQCGNSLLGTTPALLAGGIPDEAFTPISGDDRAYCTEWKRRNKKEREGQQSLFTGAMQPWQQLGNLAAAMRRLDGADDGTLAAVQAQEAAYAQLVQSSDYEHGKLWADAWAAAFLWEKRPEHVGGWAQPLTHEIFRKLGQNPYSEKGYWAEIRRLAEQYQFFHWHLAFPQVFTPEVGSAHLSALSAKVDTTNQEVTGWTGGFDVVLGNPPWDMVELSEKEFFAVHAPEIAQADTARQRQKMIGNLISIAPSLYAEFESVKRKVYATRHFIQNSGRFPLSSVGRINLYPLFVELVSMLLDENGRSGIIVPSAISMDAYNAPLFSWIIENQRLVSLFDFENRDAIFQQVHRSYRFCLLTTCGSNIHPKRLQFCYFCHDMQELHLPERQITLTPEEIKTFSPNTLSPPILVNAVDGRLAKQVYSQFGVLVDHSNGKNLWMLSIQRMLSLSDKGDIFRKVTELSEPELRDTKQWMRLYSGKAIHQFDHRFATYHGNKWVDFDERHQHVDPYSVIETEYYAKSTEVVKRTERKITGKWLVGYRDICRATDERTAIATIIPLVGCDTHCRNIYSELKTPKLIACFISNFNTFAFDYFSRQKVISTGMGSGILEQLPLLPPNIYQDNKNFLNLKWVLLRAIELIFTAYDLRHFSQDCGYHGPPFRWDEAQPSSVARRFLLRCELDAAYFHLYGIGREDVAYIMDTFPIVRRKDEAAHGEYRTKRVILEIYDEMGAAIAAADSHPRSSAGEARLGNRGYQTRLEPPPAHPDAAHPWDAAYLGPELPQEEWWQETEKVEGRRQKVEGRRQKAESESPPATVREPAPTLQLKPSPTKEPKTRPKAKPALSAQPAPVTEFTPPAGGYAQRLKRVMALGQPQNQMELTELIAALGDENSNIRWLAGSSLVKMGGTAVVKLLAAYLGTQPGAVGRDEALKVLALIGEMSEDEALRQAVKEAGQ